MDLKELITKFNNGEYEEAFKGFNEISDNSRLANEYIGVMYLCGLYVERDYKTAYEKFEKCRSMKPEESYYDNKGEEFLGLMIFNRNIC